MVAWSQEEWLSSSRTVSKSRASTAYRVVVSSRRATAEAPDDVRQRLYALAFVDEFAPLYALFTLWFVDNEVTTSQISVVFVVWAALAVVLEIPSGALADRIDRRKLIATAFALRAIGIAIWLVWPSMTGLLVGAVLWALHDAAASGAWEALIHDELEAIGDESEYGVVIARVGQFTHIGLAAGTLAASGLAQLGFGIDSIGWVNVAVHAVSIIIVLTLPDVRWAAAQSEGPTDGESVDEVSMTSWSAWRQTLSDGLAATRSDPRLLRLALLGSLLGGLFVIDEYIPLLARARGASDSAVPLIVVAVWLGLIIGGEVAARRPRLTGSSLATAMLLGTAAMAFAIAIDSPWALLVIAVGYGAVETTWVISDARFQAAAPRAVRATVTSVRGLGESLVAGLAFLIVAVRSDGEDPTPGMHWIIGLLALVSLLVWRWLPTQSAAPPDVNGRRSLHTEH